MFPELALAALLIEAAIGYPDALYRRIGHPVTWLGAIISRADEAWNRSSSRDAVRRLSGAFLVVLLLVVTLGSGYLVSLALKSVLPGIAGLVATAVIASTCLAQRSLHRHVKAVADGLETDGLAGGRRAVSLIVGRDPEALDEPGISRAAIESLAENYSDGVVAPLLWLTLLGLPGALAYKAINTADSMIGHKSPRHLSFGWAAARLDDLVNLPASRLAAMLVVLAAAFTPGASPREALGAVWRDATKHRSPNAGWPEAAMAGALGLRLAGPRVYGGVMVDDHWMGDGRAESGAADIRRALALYRAALVAGAALLALAVMALTLAP